MITPIARIGFLGFTLLFCGFAAASEDLTVLAAASLTNALSDVGKAFGEDTRIRVKFSFASSSALAKQIEQGAPADLYGSADRKWMDYLDDQGRISHDSRRDLLGNTLVLIAPRGRGFPVRMEKGFDFARAFPGRLCTGVVESVPAGIYAKDALSALAWWEGIQSRVVGVQDVRAALNLVERAECDAGVVYETDAKLSSRVEVIGRFPDQSHAPIVYPFAMITESAAARRFMDYLSQARARELFAAHGFRVLHQ